MDDSLTSPEAAAESDGGILRTVHATTPGRVYELRAALRRRGGKGRGLGLATLRLTFADARGRPVDPRVAGPDLQVPHLDPLRVETLPEEAEGDLALDAGLASRFLVAPPDAVEARLALETPGVEVLHLALEPLAVNWPAEGGKLLADVARAAAARGRLLARLFPGEGAEDQARALVQDAPLAQLRAIAAQFGRAGDWGAALALCDAAAETADRAARLARLREGEAARLTIGFIGSPRNHLRISAYADAPLLREDAWEGQLAALPLDAILVETAAESVAGDWAGAFCGLDGALSPLGRSLCAAARARGIPVRLHVTAGEGEMALWREMTETADAVAIEGDPGEWRAPPAGAAFVRRATEIAVHPPLRRGAAEGLMLAPGASDVFQHPGFAALLNEGSCHDLLLTEFDYGFTGKALADRLPGTPHRALDLSSQSQRTRLLQESTIVLLNGETLRDPGQSTAIALDAIACGAIPVLFGPGAAAAGVGAALDRVWSAAELQELQRLYRIPWLRERRWRALWRALCRDHLWTAAERAALLGRDPAAPDLDAPLTTAVMISKRPHLIGACLETFRKQSWAHKELLLVLNADAPPGPPALRDNERIFVAPASWNIGRCLNMAIRQARGRLWAKMDDDDHYSRHYLEELAAFFRATQADAAGRQSIFFFFAGPGESLARRKLHARTFRPVPDGSFVSGATLAGRTGPGLPAFSDRLRNCVDSEWVKALHAARARLMCYDSTSLVVYRDQDDAFHTWRLDAKSLKQSQFAPFCAANARDVLEGTGFEEGRP